MVMVQLWCRWARNRTASTGITGAAPSVHRKKQMSMFTEHNASEPMILTGGYYRPLRYYAEGGLGGWDPF